MYVLNNYLIILLRIEIIMISLLMFVFNYLSINNSLDMIFIFINVIIIEGIFGLSLLLRLGHSFGRDMVLN